MNVEVVTTDEAFCALEPHWNALLQDSPANTVFLTWEWVRTWWQVYGHGCSLHILVARLSSGTIVGIAPLYRRRRSLFGICWQNSISFMGSGRDVTPEYLDFIVRADVERPVTEAMVGHLMATPKVHEIDLYPFRSDSWGLDELQRRFSRTGIVRRRRAARCPVMVLPKTVEAFTASRSPNYRKKLGEYQRRCARQHAATVQCAATSDEVSRGLATLRQLHERRWMGQSRAFQSENYLAFHEQLAQRLLACGWLRLYSLESSTGTLASIYGFAYRGHFYFYQSGRDPAFSEGRVGLLLMHEVILSAIREGLSLFDFLSGDEAYKYRWATEERSSDRLTLWRSLSTRIIATAAHRGNTLRNLSRHMRNTSLAYRRRRMGPP